MSASQGHLLVIGGHEDRHDGMDILERFVELSGGAGSNIVVITAASQAGGKVWDQYNRAFGAIGVARRSPVYLDSRLAANDAGLAERVQCADGIFLSGGDQKRLLALAGGTALDAAMHAALRRGACIAGTSAGASAMSAHMLAYGQVDQQPENGAVGLGAGFGFIQNVVVDQHFSERHRLARLLTVVAQNPDLLGVGVDEDTALLVDADGGLEVIGSGTVTILDGRHMVSNVASIADHECPQMLDVRLHLLPAGARFSSAAPGPLAQFLQTIRPIA